MKRQNYLQVLDARHQQSRGFFVAVAHLVGHVLGGAVLFLAVASVSWGLGYAVESLNRIHPFPSTVLGLLHSFEIGLLWADAFLSGFVILYGFWHFLRQLGGNQHE